MIFTMSLDFKMKQQFSVQNGPNIAEGILSEIYIGHYTVTRRYEFCLSQRIIRTINVHDRD